MRTRLVSSVGRHKCGHSGEGDNQPGVGGHGTPTLLLPPLLPAFIIGSGREYSSVGSVRGVVFVDAFTRMNRSRTNTPLPHATSALGVIGGSAKPSAKPAPRAYETPVARAHRVEAL